MSGLTNHMNFAISFFVGGVSFIVMLLIRIPIKMLTAKIAEKRYPDYSERVRKRAESNFGSGSNFGSDRNFGFETGSNISSGSNSGAETESIMGSGSIDSDPFSISVEEKVSEYKRERNECVRVFRRRLNFILIVITFAVAVLSYSFMLDLFHEEHFKLCYALKGGCMALSLYAVFEQFFGSVE